MKYHSLTRKKAGAVLALLAAAASGGSLNAAPYTWNTTSGTWDTTTSNWSSGGSAVQWTNLSDAYFAGADGTYAVNVALSTGTAATLNFKNSGYTLSASSLTTLTLNNAANTLMVDAGKSASIGNNLILATLETNKNAVIGGGGSLNLNAGSKLLFNGNLNSNTLSINATTVNLAAGAELATKQLTGANGSALFINGDLNVNGGLANIPGTLGIGQTSSSGVGTLTINSGTVIAPSANGVRFGASSGTTQGGTINLNGGTLQTYRVQKGAGTVTSSILNLNGGTLVSTTTHATFITGLDRVNVRNGGAKIDSAGFDITIAQGLLHSDIGGDEAVDGGLTKEGLGILTLSGNNTYTGATVVNAGKLSVTGSLSGNGNLTAAGGAEIAISSSVTDASLSNAGLTKNGLGTLTLSGSNSYTGLTTINSGTVALASTNALAGGGNLTFNGGLLQHSANNTRDYSSRIVNSGSAIAIDTNGQSVTYGSALNSTNTGGLTKVGSGTLTLNGANSYTGPTAVNAGTLVITGNRTVVGGTHSVSAGARLHVQANLAGSAIHVGGILTGDAFSGAPIGAVTVASTGTIAPGTLGGSLGALAFTSLTGTTGAVYSIQLGKVTPGSNPTARIDFERVSATSVLLNDMTLDLQTTANTGGIEFGDIFYILNNQGGSAIQGIFAGLAEGTEFDWEGHQFRISYSANWTGNYGTSGMTGGNDIALLVIPEPNTWAMFVGGFGMLLSFQRLRRKRVGTR